MDKELITAKAKECAGDILAEMELGRLAREQYDAMAEQYSEMIAKRLEGEISALSAQKDQLDRLLEEILYGEDISVKG
ncbi:MAG: hypothetical protein ACI4WS_11295 [Oscillospiraceae bacterium]